MVHAYWGAYFQDDWRVNSKFTLNYGLRLEHEDGLREINNRQTVAFDQNAVNPIDALVPKTGTLLAGKTLKGGLIYAGVNGAPTQQGNPKAIKPAPRVGVDLRDRPEDGPPRRLRPVLGAVELQHDRSTARPASRGPTQLSQSAPESDVPIDVLDNPFPSGLLAPIGSSLGLLTNVGGQVDFIDQNKGNPKVHQYSVDIQRELPGSDGDDDRLHRRHRTRHRLLRHERADVDQHQPDRSERSRGSCSRSANGGWDAAKLRESVPNPFFGIAAAGEFGTRATIARGQLLRPFPEFGDILMHESTDGSKRQYQRRRRSSWTSG